MAFVALLWTVGEMSFTIYLGTLIGALVGTLAICVVAIWRTTRESAWIMEKRPVYARWYSIAVIAMVSVTASNLFTYKLKRPYHSFYIPSEAMEPTLIKNDKLVALMRPPRDPPSADQGRVG